VVRSARLPLLGVLGLRIALVAAATILLFNSIAPWLKEQGYRWLDVEYALYPDLAAIASELAAFVEDPTLPERDPEFAERLDAITQALVATDTAFYVLDRAGRLLYRSQDLARVEPEVLTSSSEFTVEIDGEAAGFGFGSLYPIARDGSRIGLFGTVALFLSDDARPLFAMPLDGVVGDARPVSEHKHVPVLALASTDPIARRRGEDAARRRALESRFERVRQVVDVSVPVVSALVLGGLASLLVTRRLLGMVAVSRRPGAHGVPGPFETSGSDEVAELARALDDMRERNIALVRGLERRDVARREWVAQVSHDLRTPLTSLQVCLERVHAADPVGADPALEEAVRLARHDAERVGTLAEDLLEAARLESGVELQLEPILPREVVQQALRSVRPLAGRDGKQLVLEGESAAAAGAEWLGDGARLVRACENLLRNAVRHARSRVEVAVEPGPGVLRFRVRDDGTGFGGPGGEVDLRRVGVIGESSGSSGLGLLVVERIAAAHGGRLCASNRPGGGAEVWFEIAARPA